MKSSIRCTDRQPRSRHRGHCGAVTIVAATARRARSRRCRQVMVKFSESVVAFGDPRLADPFDDHVPGRVAGWQPAAGRATASGCTTSASRSARDPLHGDRAQRLEAGREAPRRAPAHAAVARHRRDRASRFPPAARRCVAMSRGDGAHDRGGPALPAAPERRGRREQRCSPTPGARSKASASGSAMRRRRRRAADAAAEGAPHRGARAERTLIARLRAAAAERRCDAAGLGQGHRRSGATRRSLTTIEQRLRFIVRAAFTAEFSCERERANAPCLPIRPMSAALLARRCRASSRRRCASRPASGEPLAPVFDKDDKASEVERGRVPEAAAPRTPSFSVELPRDAEGQRRPPARERRRASRSRSRPAARRRSPSSPRRRSASSSATPMRCCR